MNCWGNYSNAVKCLEDSDNEDKEDWPFNALLPNIDETDMLHQIECRYEPIVK